jgi:hypothetical protein
MPSADRNENRIEVSWADLACVQPDKWVDLRAPGGKDEHSITQRYQAHKLAKRLYMHDEEELEVGMEKV